MTRLPLEDPMLDFAQARRMMVDSQVRTFDVNDLAVLAAFDEVPREGFVPAGRESLAYMDQNLPVSDGDGPGERRFMLAPMVLARMIQALELAPGQRVLDIGGGLGYSAAVLLRLGCSVIALETRGPRRGDAPAPRRRGGRRGRGRAARPRLRGCGSLRCGAGQRGRRDAAGDVAAPAWPSAGGSPASRDEDGPRGRLSMCAPATRSAHGRCSMPPRRLWRRFARSRASSSDAPPRRHMCRFFAALPLKATGRLGN